MPQFSNISKQRLYTCAHELQVVCLEAIQIIDFVVLEGHRDEVAQNLAYSRGASKLRWPNGKHNRMPSDAIDLVPVYYESGMKIDWGDLVAFGRMMGVIQAIAYKHKVPLRYGLDWDGDFRSVGRDSDETFMDAPHVEVIRT